MSTVSALEEGKAISRCLVKILFPNTAIARCAKEILFKIIVELCT